MEFNGETTVVETIGSLPQRSIGYLGEIKSPPSNEELDLAKVLALYDHEFKPHSGSYDSETVGEEEADIPLQVIFSREVGISRENEEEELDQEAETPLPPPEELPSIPEIVPSTNTAKSLQNQNNNYQEFLEELILVNCCSKQILQLLEDTKVLLSQQVFMKNDPGFGSISKIKAWIWILKEALITVNLVGSKDKTKAQPLNELTGEICTRIEKIFKGLHQELKSLKKIYDKVEHEFLGIISKSQKRFSNNQEAAEEYEIISSSINYPFLLADKSTGSYADCCVVEAPKQTQDNKIKDSDSSLILRKKSAHPHRTLHVRCSIDGITVRSGIPGKQWLKLQNIKRFKDLQVFFKIFVHALCKDCVTARQTVGLANQVLQIHQGLFLKRKTTKFKDSILRSILKCKEILEKPKRILTFLPKEEVMILYSLKSALSRFELIKPIVIDLILLFEKDFDKVLEFCYQKRDFKKSNKLSRVPIDRMTKLDMDIEDTKVNVAMMLNRYPNRHEAKRMMEKLKQGLDVSNDDDLEGPVDVVYRGPSDLYISPSAQEMLEWGRTSVKNHRRHFLLPNPAYYSFRDVGQEYKEMTMNLATARKITPESFSLCSDPIRKFHQAIENIDHVKENIIAQLIQATESLLYSELYKDEYDPNIEPPDPTLIPTSFWIQILCRMLHIWDFNSLPKHYQRHFVSVNKRTMSWIGRLENSFSKFEESLKQYKDDCQKLEECIESVHGFSTWIKRKFSFTLPRDIVIKWKNQSQAESSTYKNPEKSHGHQLPNLELRFSPFDMDIVTVGPDKTFFHLLSLNKCSGSVQVGIVSTFFSFLDNVVSRAIVNLNCAQSLFENNISIKTLKNALSVDKKFSTLQYIHQLEDMILALSFERNHKIINEITAYVGLLDSAIGQFNHLFQTVQLQLEDRGIVQISSDSRREKIQKKVWQEEISPLNQEIWLNETKQIFRSSVEAMPVIFEIQVDSLKNSLLQWVKIERKDRCLMEIIISQHASVENEIDQEEYE